MTRPHRIKEKCVMCGHEQNHTELMSTNSFGYMDLDTRPPEMARSTLKYMIQMCENCAYANEEISEMIKGIDPEDLKTASYKAVLNDDKINRTAKAFLLAGQLYRQVKKFKTSGLHHLGAAWTFDDLEEQDNAKQARDKAIEDINKHVERSDNTNLSVMRVDLYRRNGRFKEAEEAAEQLIGQGVKDIMKKVLKLQIKLCQDKDDRCHTVEEAL